MPDKNLKTNLCQKQKCFEIKKVLPAAPSFVGWNFKTECHFTFDIWLGHLDKPKYTSYLLMNERKIFDWESFFQLGKKRHFEMSIVNWFICAKINRFVSYSSSLLRWQSVGVEVERDTNGICYLILVRARCSSVFFCFKLNEMCQFSPSPSGYRFSIDVLHR